MHLRFCTTVPLHEDCEDCEDCEDREASRKRYFGEGNKSGRNSKFTLTRFTFWLDMTWHDSIIGLPFKRSLEQSLSGWSCVKSSLWFAFFGLRIRSHNSFMARDRRSKRRKRLILNMPLVMLVFLMMPRTLKSRKYRLLFLLLLFTCFQLELMNVVWRFLKMFSQHNAHVA